MKNYERINSKGEKEEFITIGDLVKGKPTLKQLDIFSRADRVLKDKKGRYYGGKLTDEEIGLIDPEFKKDE
ncbi:MAG: hypothetical protein A3B91_04725 [Candidatus Yanofskybacteria bacterium RIFCSPHIGHO2_02_FULL_41_29]|uniref:Uncharacterized protein n=1 Tax=Candidatus Yanofskybacteria bacterium RIFCSPHIGHO2_01_FULL_41_53 TaxID=1802663 RepID=A0A1F8EJQ3_9BACT|nr:MAG: hypothetical protein A2650_04510 [Candidatus Yanofskybacteria bacterium RIFCSPHIGHO2_01_FULL_41_53]OGN11499.1 MAG: hypothetical protein A3B91_04725 [Candidatus Yanofskybacteria bacterium RIFCSPHIGHO2_02_FULL_41_29]OGN17157.1 MAG: hypothetical protein A3F48_04045 [Candidatus Yanofskybacteria bacterium RIFCSPHIGHO2_12_FULL_41_9]OGN22609.1 MAG: hypothetical protein A2916_03120 [Candidatus Yanofskybacteria bacterium RIFCSPLOWO2_01_FULL_41_67]OGN29768.1 MAG: hypothetical protein A3H54_04290 